MKITYIVLLITIIKLITSSHINSLSFSKKIFTDYTKQKKERALIESHDYKCNKELLIAYGLDGNLKPEVLINKFCPSVKISCCEKKDIEETENLFNKNKKKIERYYETYLYSLQYLLGFSKEIFNLAHQHHQHKNEKCREISQNFLKSGMDNLESDIMYNIFGDSLKEVKNLRKGFYCILCDGVNHPFFTDLNSGSNYKAKNSVLFSKEFCKKLVDKTSKASFYLVNRLKRYLDDLAILMTCSKEVVGDFTYKIENSENIELCYKSKDKDDFFSLGCQTYCENFKLSEPSKILDGDLEQLKKYVFLVMENRKEIFKNPTNNSINEDINFIEDILKFNYKEVLQNKTFFDTKHTDQFLENFNSVATFAKGMDPFNSVESSNYSIVFIYSSFLKRSVLVFLFIIFIYK